MTFATHRANPHISLDQHVKGRVVELGQLLANRTAIYLDTKFWILLRDAAKAKSTDNASAKLLRMLCSLVSEERIFCPISESTLLELIKQDDLRSRMETVRLIDELSQGVSLLPHQMRVATEIAHFLQQSMGDVLHPLCHLVWLKLAYVMGFAHPSSTSFDPQTELVVQKAFFDHMWDISLEDYIGGADGDALHRLDFNDLAQDLNVGISQHADNLKNFAQVYTDELRGAAEACGDVAAQIMCDLAQKEGITPPEPGSVRWLEARRVMENAIFLALKKSPKTRLQLRTLNIGACLHAAFRWDKPRRFTSNDIYDFNHASAAIAYCRAFFTEHPLRSMTKAGNVALDTLYGCDIISGVPDAVAFLEKLRAESPDTANNI
jgi:hypothetical protein